MSGLLGFLIAMIALLGVGAIFFLTIDQVAKSPILAKIAKIAVGCLILIVFIMAVAAVLGFGGAASPISAMGIIIFAVGVLVLIGVLYIVDLVLNWLAGAMGLDPPVVEAIRFIISLVALIALLYLAGTALLGGGNFGMPFRLRG